MKFPATDPRLADAILYTVFSTCQQREVPCFITGGTLLGIYRDGTYIPWDNDLDVTAIYTPEGHKGIISDLFHWGFLTDMGTQWENKHFWKYKMLVDIHWVMPEGFYAKHDILHHNNRVYHAPYPLEDYLEWKYGSTWRTPLEKGQYPFQHEE